MPVFFTGVVTGVKNANTGNIHHEHGSTKYMASSIAPEAYAINFKCLVEVYDLHHNYILIQCPFSLWTFNPHKQNQASAVKIKNPAIWKQCPDNIGFLNLNFTNSTTTFKCFDNSELILTHKCSKGRKQELARWGGGGNESN